jgi:hypothetical protein
MSDEARIEIVIGARLDRIDERMAKLQSQVGGAMRKVQRDLDIADSRWQKLFGKGNPGKALDDIFSHSRLAAIDAGSARIPIFGSALAELGPVGLIAAAGVGAAALAFTQAKAAMSFADELGDTANRLHVTTDALQEYRYAIRLAGGEEKGADDALEGFSETLGKAQAGFAKAQKGFKLLGFTKEQIDSFGTVEEGLDAVTEKIGKLTSNPQKDAVISQLGLTGMKPLLEEGIDALQRLKAEAHEVGAVMDANLIDRAGKAQDEYETLSKVIDIQLKSAFVDLGPVLIDLLTLAAKLARAFNDVAASFKDVQDRSTLALERKRDQLAASIASDKKDSAFLPGAKEYIAYKQGKLDKINAELGKRAETKPDGPGVPKPPNELADISTHTGPTAAEKTARGRQAVDDAMRSEMQAQAALTEDIDKLAKLRSDEVDLALKKKTDALRAEVAAGRIDAGLADEAIAIEGRAAVAAKQKIEDDRIYDAKQRELRNWQDLAKYSDELSTIQAAMATTTRARYEIEKRALINRQKAEMAEAKLRLYEDERTGKKTTDQVDDTVGALEQKQAAERGQLRRQEVDEYKAGLLEAADALKGGLGNAAEYFVEKLRTRLLDRVADVLAQMIADASAAGETGGPNGGSIWSSVGQAAASIFGHNDAGTDSWRGGLTMTGESGPELINLPKGAQVIPNHVLRALGSMNPGAAGARVASNTTIDLRGAYVAEEVWSRVSAQLAASENRATINGARLGQAQMATALRSSQVNKLGLG